MLPPSVQLHTTRCITLDQNHSWIWRAWVVPIGLYASLGSTPIIRKSNELCVWHSHQQIVKSLYMCQLLHRSSLQMQLYHQVYPSWLAVESSSLHIQSCICSKTTSHKLCSFGSFCIWRSRRTSSPNRHPTSSIQHPCCCQQLSLLWTWKGDSGSSTGTLFSSETEAFLCWVWGWVFVTNNIYYEQSASWSGQSFGALSLVIG